MTGWGAPLRSPLSEGKGASPDQHFLIGIGASRCDTCSRNVAEVAERAPTIPWISPYGVSLNMCAVPLLQLGLLRRKSKPKVTYEHYQLYFEGIWNERLWRYLPSKSGIYCVYAGKTNFRSEWSLRQLLYIGESENVCTRVPQEPMTRRDRWAMALRLDEELIVSFAEIRPGGARERSEAAMIFRHKPPFNKTYKCSFPYDTTTVSTTGKNIFLESSFVVGRT